MQEPTTKNLRCPTCNTPVQWSENFPYRPFCSERCQLIDLGEWAAEKHRIPGDDSDLMSEDFDRH